jgi:DNA-binding CsgD family transcriptional regulator
LILGVTEATVKKHLEHIFGKLGVERRGAASLIALETLGA